MFALLLLVGVTVAQDIPDSDSTSDNTEPDARVARISHLSGKAQIKRIDAEEWEEAVENLPIVEGDSIQTDSGTKLELQFDDYTYLRMNENTSLKLTVLADDGIALSVPKGLIGVTLIKFDVDETYFEIDAPSSTVTLQKNGRYRIDAGDDLNKEVRVSIADIGEARVYSKDSGFALKPGRLAVLRLDGQDAGEWQNSRNSGRSDGFDLWLQDRDQMIATKLGSQDNGYVDSDVYGDDDLDQNGDWVNTNDYGPVWRPSSRATSRYSNWSPYRYGQWRWLPYYGWTWVNDEPWGWATYHSGRWIHWRGQWVWSPHRRYQRSRSWWRPALVYVAYINNNYCWYPLPYGYGYYDYNRRFRNNWGRGPRVRGPRNGRGNQGGNGGNGGGGATTPSVPVANVTRGVRNNTPPLGRVPTRGVVSVPANQFGKGRRGMSTPPLSVARTVLRKKPTVVDSPPFMPSFDDNDRKRIRRNPAPDRKTFDKQTGATKRTDATPLDRKLRRERINGNRVPVQTRTKATSNSSTKNTNRSRTGAFDRTKTRPRVDTPPVRSTDRTTVRRTTTRQKPAERKSSSDTKTERRSKPPVRRSPPVRKTTPTRKAQPKRTAPTRSVPKRTAPSRRAAPKRKATPKKAAPKRSAPKKRSVPKPSRSKPKSDSSKKGKS